MKGNEMKDNVIDPLGILKWVFIYFSIPKVYSPPLCTPIFGISSATVQLFVSIPPQGPRHHILMTPSLIVLQK